MANKKDSGLPEFTVVNVVGFFDPDIEEEAESAATYDKVVLSFIYHLCNDMAPDCVREDFSKRGKVIHKGLVPAAKELAFVFSGEIKNGIKGTEQYSSADSLIDNLRERIGSVEDAFSQLKEADQAIEEAIGFERSRVTIQGRNETYIHLLRPIYNQFEASVNNLYDALDKYEEENAMRLLGSRGNYTAKRYITPHVLALLIPGIVASPPMNCLKYDMNQIYNWITALAEWYDWTTITSGRSLQSYRDTLRSGKYELKERLSKQGYPVGEDIPFALDILQRLLDHYPEIQKSFQ